MDKFSIPWSPFISFSCKGRTGSILPSQLHGVKEWISVDLPPSPSTKFHHSTCLLWAMLGCRHADGLKICPRVASDIHSESAGPCSLAEYKTGNPFNYLWSRRWGMCVWRRRSWRKNCIPARELGLSGPFSSACRYPTPSLFVWPSPILLHCPSLQPFLLFSIILCRFLALSFLLFCFSPSLAI